MSEDETLEQGAELAESESKPAESVEIPEGEEKVSKGEEKVSEKKPKEAIPAEVKAAADAVETYRKSEAYQKEIQSAKDKSINEETAPLRQEIADLKQSAADKELTTRESTESAKWTEDGIPEETIKSFHEAGRALIVLKNATETSASKHQTELAELHAYKLSQKTGVEMKALLGCKTPEEMDAKAQELVDKAKDAKIVSLEEEKKAAVENAAKTQKIASDTTGATGVDMESMSPRQLIQLGVDKQKKT